jgi:hypothetical protein
MRVTTAGRDIFFTFTPRVSVFTPSFALDDDIDEDEDEDDDDESESDDDDDEESDEDDEDDEDEDEEEPETWQVSPARRIPLKYGGA